MTPPYLPPEALEDHYRKISTFERLPDKEGEYITDKGFLQLQFIPKGIGLKAGPYWSYGYSPIWWLEQVPCKQPPDALVKRIVESVMKLGTPVFTYVEDHNYNVRTAIRTALQEGGEHGN